MGEMGGGGRDGVEGLGCETPRQQQLVAPPKWRPVPGAGCAIGPAGRLLIAVCLRHVERYVLRVGGVR